MLLFCRLPFCFFHEYGGLKASDHAHCQPIEYVFGRYWYVLLVNRVVITSLLVPGGNIPDERELREGRLKFNLASQSADLSTFSFVCVSCNCWPAMLSCTKLSQP